MKSLKVKSELASVLSTFVGRTFTVDHLTEAYLNNSEGRHSSKKAARQFVYRNMLRMIKTGALTRVVVDGGWPLYQLTPTLTAVDTPISSEQSKSLQISDTQNFKAVSHRNLHDRLKRYRLEMLSAMGEAEEYDTICGDIPELRDEIQPLYNQSRDNCSKLLGRVKALESVLMRESGTQE